MTEQQKKDQITPEEIDEQTASELPEREAMSLVNLNLAAPVNAAVAANVLSDGAIAYANAEQTADIDQSTTPALPDLD